MDEKLSMTYAMNCYLQNDRNVPLRVQHPHNENNITEMPLHQVQPATNT